MAEGRGALGRALGLALVLLWAAEAEAARPGGGQSFSSSSFSSGSGSSYSGSSYSGSSYSGPSYSGSSYSGSSYSGSSYSGSSYSGSYSGSSSGSSSLGEGGIIALSIMFFGLFGGLVGFGIKGIRDIVRARRLADELLARYAGPSLLGGVATPTPSPDLPLVAEVVPSRARSRSRRRPAARSVRTRPRRIDAGRVRKMDPDFSEIVFRDLAFRLYAEAYLAAFDPAASEGLTPYLSDRLLDELPSRVDGVVAAVLVGNLRIRRYGVDGEEVTLTAEYAANLITEDAFGRTTTFYAVERWEYRRRREAKTRPPAQVIRLGCPSCGAPFARGDQRRCAHCDQVVDDGRLEWRAVSRTIRAWERQLSSLAGSVAEVGTDEPTRRQIGLQRRIDALTREDPSFTLPGLVARTTRIYEALNEGWNAEEPRLFRPYVSDALFDYLRYWLRAYREQSLRNRVESMRITAIHVAKVERDAYFDAITVRVFAVGLDYTLSAGGEVVSGSRALERAYSEYWTLIRGRGVTDSPRDRESCPACGAPRSITMAGNCDHCESHLTFGEFDWVLSRIEQDEVYRG